MVEPLAIHLISEQAKRLNSGSEGNTVDVTIGGMKHHIANSLPGPGGFQDLDQGNASPSGVSGPGAADFITDAGKRGVHGQHGHLLKLGHGEAHGHGGETVDFEGPIAAGHHGIDGVLGHGVELVGGGDFLAETGDIGKHSGSVLDAAGGTEPEVVGALHRSDDGDSGREQKDAACGRRQGLSLGSLDLEHAREHPVRGEQEEAGGKRALGHGGSEQAFAGERKKNQDVGGEEREGGEPGVAERAFEAVPEEGEGEVGTEIKDGGVDERELLGVTSRDLLT